MNLARFCCTAYLLAFLLLISFAEVSGQTYGLAFSAYEKTKDKRTGLDLTPKESFELDGEFEIAFDLRVLPQARKNRFGYVFRSLISGGHNLDLLYEKGEEGLNPASLSIIAGNKRTNLKHFLPAKGLYDEYNRVRIILNTEKQSVCFVLNDSVLCQSDLPVQTGGYKLNFGTVSKGVFSITDVLSMAVKDIKISNDGNLIHHWPLDEREGTLANDRISGWEGRVKHPIWLNRVHSQWEKLYEATIDGFAQVACDTKKNQVYFVGDDTVSWIDLRRGIETGVRVDQPDFKLMVDNHAAVYDVFSKRLISYSIDKKQAFYFDFSKGKWSGAFNPEGYPHTVYLHHSKTILLDSTMLCFGGYGKYKYRNEVNRLKLGDLSWSKVNYTGDFWTPRYLAATGYEKLGNTIYLIGGFGSESGEQALNPSYCYDLYAYSVANSTFKKVYSFGEIREDFCFANSLFIDEESKTYYGLIYSKYEYDTELRIISGSLERPEYKIMPTGIPYKFHDLSSYADLFFLPESKKLLTVVVNYDRKVEKKTYCKVYSLNFPPNFGQPQESKKEDSAFWKLLFVVLAVIAMGVGFVVWYKRKGKVRSIGAAPRPDLQNSQEAKIEEAAKEEPKEQKLKPKEQVVEDKQKPNSLYLFGRYSLFNQEALEIAPQFSPLQRELFFLILFNSIERKGIGSKELDQVLWFDKSPQSAKNNRAVNIAKLRNALNQVDGIELIQEKKLWKFQIDEALFYCDLIDLKNIIAGRGGVSSAERLKAIVAIVKKGALLKNFDFEWLDRFKATISDDIINTLLLFMQEDSIQAQALVEATDALFVFDPVNEEAIKFKCKGLVQMGKHSLALDAFRRFTLEYEALYNEKYPEDYKALIGPLVKK